MSKYPECDKLSALLDSGESAAVQGFLDWLLDEYRVEGSEQYCSDGERAGVCLGWWREKSLAESDLLSAVLEPVSVTRESLMYAYFGLDKDKIEAERRIMLSSLHE